MMAPATGPKGDQELPEIQAAGAADDAADSDIHPVSQSRRQRDQNPTVAGSKSHMEAQLLGEILPARAPDDQARPGNGDGNQNVPLGDNTIQHAPETLSEDIYSLAVTSIVKGVKGKRLMHVLCAMVFAALVQLGTLVLLWCVVLEPSGATGTSEAEQLWGELGQLQGQLCWVQGGLQLNGIDINKPERQGANCSGAWPHASRTVDTIWASEIDACPGLNNPFIPAWQDAKPCFRHVTQPTYSDTDEGDNTPANCSDIVASLGPALAAFGRGLLYPRTDQLYGYHGSRSSTKELINGSWVLKNLSCCTSNESDYADYHNVTTGLPKCDPWLHTASMENNSTCPQPVASHAKCIRPQSKREAGLATLIVNLLAYLAIAIFVHGEVRCAAVLCHVAAAVAGILPRFYHNASTKVLDATAMSPHLLARIVVLLIPIVQLLVALLVLLSAGLLSVVQEYQASGIQVILTSVALGFILEIDNKVGKMVLTQHRGLGSINAMPAWHDLSTYVGPSRNISCMGHLYFSFVGLLLVVEPVLLTPHVAILVLLAAFEQTKSNIVLNGLQKLALGSTWGSYVLPPWLFQAFIPPDAAWYSAMLTVISPESLPGFDTSISICFLYAGMVISFVLLLFYTPLPSVAFRWPQTLLALQTILASMVCFLPVDYPFPVLFQDYGPVGGIPIICLTTAFVSLMTWLGMFVLWPTCHNWSLDSAQPMPCCTCCHRTCRGLRNTRASATSAGPPTKPAASGCFGKLTIVWGACLGIVKHGAVVRTSGGGSNTTLAPTTDSEEP